MFRIEVNMAEEIKREQIIIKNDKNEIIFNKMYDDEILLLKDIQINVLGRYLIYYKNIKNEITTLKRSDGSLVELINIKSKVILDLIDRHMLKSFKQFLNLIIKEKYYEVSLIGSNSNVGFELIQKDDQEKVLICEFELNEDKTLTRNSQEMLKTFMNNNVKGWNKNFLSKKERFKTVICCDDKIITINNFLLRYINNDIDYEQIKYNNILKKIEGKVL